MEVSMPTGSLCAERNVIGSALASDLSLRREQLLAVAVLSVRLEDSSGKTRGPAKEVQPQLLDSGGAVTPTVWEEYAPPPSSTDMQQSTVLPVFSPTPVEARRITVNPFPEPLSWYTPCPCPVAESLRKYRLLSRPSPWPRKTSSGSWSDVSEGGFVALPLSRARSHSPGFSDLEEEVRRGVGGLSAKASPGRSSQRLIRQLRKKGHTLPLPTYAIHDTSFPYCSPSPTRLLTALKIPFPPNKCHQFC